MAIANITAMFWPMVEAIVMLDYDDLMRTRFYDVMHKCMTEEKEFTMDICGYFLHHKNVNDLFYDTRDFLLHIDEREKAQVVHQAIMKMQGVVMEIEMCECVSRMNIDTDNVMDGLNAVLAQLNLDL